MQVAEFHAFVRPVQNKTLSAFCSQLTGISQAQVDAADDLPSTITKFHAWLTAQGSFLELFSLFDQPSHLFVGLGCVASPTPNFALLTDGPWDLRNFLDEECKRKSLEKPAWFSQWVNLRWLFAEFLKCRRGGVKSMLTRMGTTFVGREHSGIDDTRNIARIAQWLLQRTPRLVSPARRRRAHSPPPPHHQAGANLI